MKTILETLRDARSVFAVAKASGDGGVDEIIADLDAAIDRAAIRPHLAIILEGGLVQAVISDHAEVATEMILGLSIIDYDTDGSDAEEREAGMVRVPQSDGGYSDAFIRGEEITQAAIPLATMADWPDYSEGWELRAAKAAGWVLESNGSGSPLIYNTNDYDSWKEAVSYSPDRGATYETWAECFEAECFDPEDQIVEGAARG